MPLPAYGLLIGTPVASRPQSGGHPHWLIMVKPALDGHPPYRVAVNLSSSAPNQPPEIEYQIIDVATEGTSGLKDIVRKLTDLGPTKSFVTDTDLRLDFVRGGLIADGAGFTKVQPGKDPLHSAFEQALVDAISLDESTDGVPIAIFGTGYPINRRTGTSPGTGYTGIDNIHMNQGSPNVTGGGDHYLENGPNQDGGLIFLFPTGAKAFFVKFQSQALDTDEDGNPNLTPHADLNAKIADVRPLLKRSYEADVAAGAPPAGPLHLRQRVSNPVGQRSALPLVADAAAITAPALPPGAPGYVFAQPDPDVHGTGQFLADDDGGTYKTPYVTQYAKGKVRGPVPTPRSLEPMLLTSVVGNDVPGFSTDAQGVQTIVFDLLGDSGAASAKKLVGEKTVGDMLAEHSKIQQPAFMFHVGDVVYFYGEKQFYYGQFADIFRNYPAPIFAIPGNHDAITYDPSMMSLDSFQQAFCSATPSHWDGFGGIARTTMTQPGVFFRLDAPLVSIIGLYSNCGESLGWLDEQQYAFLQMQLDLLKTKRAADGCAVILAIHHFPRWFPGQKDPVSQRIDAICQDVGFWPDAVVAGHAHVYQRIIRPLDDGRTIPYFVDGCCGYGVSPLEAVGKNYVAGLPASKAVQKNEEGYLRATVTKAPGSAANLTFDYYSVKSMSDGPVDHYSIQLV